MKILFAFFGTLVLGLILLVPYSGEVYAIADGMLPGEGNTFETPAPEDVPEEINNPDFRDQLLTIINYFLTFVGIIAVAALIYFGFLWLVSGGNEEQIETGKKGIIYVALGIIVILFSYVLVAFLIDAGNGPPDANAARSQYITKEEQVVMTHLDMLQETIDQAYEYDLVFLQEVKNDYNGLFDDLSNTEERRIFEYHLISGNAKNEHGKIQRYFSEISTILLALESASEEEQRTLKKQIESIVDNIQVSLRNIKEVFEDIPRMEASISVKPKDGNAPLTVAIDGLESTDPTNTTIPSANYSWSFTDYDGIEKDLGTGPNKVLTFDQPGNYILLLRVNTASYEKVLPGYATTSIIVEPQGLTADFLVNGEDQGSIVKIPLHDAKKGVRFDPAPTVIPKGVLATEYIWNFGGEKRSTGSGQEIVSQIFPKEGQFTISLEVTDNTGEKSTKKTKIIVESSVAVIDISTASPLLNEIVTFNGQRSTQEGGPATVYSWKIFDIDGVLLKEVQDRPQFSHQFDTVGMYTVQLDVGNGITASKQIEVRSKPPVASFSAKKQNPANMADVFFDASASYDPEKGPLVYHWDFDGDGSLDLQNQKTPTTTHTYLSEGDYTPRLLVTDEHGNTADSFRDIHIDSTFFVDFSVDSLAVHTGEDVRFFVDTNQGTLFSWEFGDGQHSETNENVKSHIYSQPGRYVVRLTAYNDDGKNVQTESPLYVGGEGEPIPVVSLKKDGVPIDVTKDLCGSQKDGVSLFRYELLEFSGEGSVDSLGKDGAGLEYRWDIGGKEKKGVSVSQEFIQTTSSESCIQSRLILTDSVSGKSISSNPVYVLVKNALPEISDITVKPEKTPCTAPCEVDLSAVGVSDPDGTISQYRWWATTPGVSDKIGIHLSVSPESSIILPALGIEGKENTFTIHLEIIDNNGGATIAEDALFSLPQVEVINGENPEHIVDFFVERSSLAVGQEFVFSAKVQNLLGDAIPESAYKWDFNGDGVYERDTGSLVRHTYSVPGEYNVRLDVEHRGISNGKIRRVFVTEEKQYPVADFTFITRGLQASFDAGNTEWDQSAGNTPPEYVWDFDAFFDSDGDGVLDNDMDANGEKVDHIYPQKGSYVVRLTTTDKDGNRDIHSKTITVGESSAHLSQNDTIIRNAQTTGNAPSVILDLLVRVPDNSNTPAEVVAYGFSPDGSLLVGDVTIESIGGIEPVIDGPIALEYGRASTFLIGQRVPDTTYSVTATVKTPFGTLRESISF